MRRVRNRGLTLLEVLIALGTASVLWLGAMAIMSGMRKNEKGLTRQTENISDRALRLATAKALKRWRTFPIRCGKDELIVGLKPNREPVCVKFSTVLPKDETRCPPGQLLSAVHGDGSIVCRPWSRNGNPPERPAWCVPDPSTHRCSIRCARGERLTMRSWSGPPFMTFHEPEEVEVWDDTDYSHAVPGSGPTTSWALSFGICSREEPVIQGRRIHCNAFAKVSDRCEIACQRDEVAVPDYETSGAESPDATIWKIERVASNKLLCHLSEGSSLRCHAYCEAAR